MKIHQELPKFFVVGFINTVFGYSIYSLFIFLGFNYFLAALISQIIGTLFNYKTIATYVFPNGGNNKFFNHYSKFQLYLMDPAKSLGDKKKIEVLDELSAPDGPLKLLALEQKLNVYVMINDLENIKLQD